MVFTDDLQLNTGQVVQEFDMEEFDSDEDFSHTGSLWDAAGSSQGHPNHMSNLTQIDNINTQSPGSKRGRDGSGKKSAAKLAKKLFHEQK